MLDPTEKLIRSAFECCIILRFGTSQASYPTINVQLLNRRYLLSGDLPRVVEGVDPYKSPTTFIVGEGLDPPVTSPIKAF